ncbi:MAG: DUF4157 domain-containing protein, partial [Actinobacteria bacterium]|nr:DUF4157 domain-containing protein [Actinomycetota bacterium]
ARGRGAPAPASVERPPTARRRPLAAATERRGPTQRVDQPGAQLSIRRGTSAIAPATHRTPDERFSHALASAPPAPPVLLPGRFSALSRAITGRRTSYRSGHAVRTALRASSARAATVDGVLHLPRPPDDAPSTRGVVAHELAHVAERGRHTPRHVGPTPGRGRPRFFLDRLSGIADRGERHARRVGDLARERASAAVPDVQQMSSLGNLGDRVSAALPGLPTPADLADTARAALPGLPAVRAPGTLARDVLAATGVPSLPDVGDLPVGGPGAAVSAARRMLDGDPLAGMSERASGAGDGLAGAAAEAVSGLHDRASAATGQLGERAGGLADTVAAGLGATENATPGAVTEATQSVGGAVDAATDVASGAVGSLLTAAASAATDVDSQVSALVEVLEERVLAELERRGGQFAGVF